MGIDNKQYRLVFSTVFLFTSVWKQLQNIYITGKSNHHGSLDRVFAWFLPAKTALIHTCMHIPSINVQSTFCEGNFHSTDLT